MKSLKDYMMRTTYLDKGQPTLVPVCAPDVISAHSEVWLKLPNNRHSLVDTFEIMTIETCAHQNKGGAR